MKKSINKKLKATNNEPRKFRVKSYFFNFNYADFKGAGMGGPAPLSIDTTPGGNSIENCQQQGEGCPPAFPAVIPIQNTDIHYMRYLIACEIPATKVAGTSNTTRNKQATKIPGSRDGAVILMISHRNTARAL